MKASEIRNLSVQELNEKLSDLKSELFNLRFQHAINQLENPMRLGAVKKDIARVKTIIREKELAERKYCLLYTSIPLPTEREIVTILRAVHIYKDSREQFETRTHKRLIDILRPSNKTVEALTSLELPAGVEIEIKL